ncbi:hypothetical protein M3Y99_00893800 [Aphelenchoides fujianensis]|nr:hypothetical protein M3Y99_00893800 [Aphelenchoides fujianensis]
MSSFGVDYWRSNREFSMLRIVCFGLLLLYRPLHCSSFPIASSSAAPVDAHDQHQRPSLSHSDPVVDSLPPTIVLQVNAPSSTGSRVDFDGVTRSFVLAAHERGGESDGRSMGKTLEQIQHLLQMILSLLEKLLILMAVVGFLALQFLVFKLLDKLHWWCVRRKREQRSVADANVEMKQMSWQRY